MTSQVEVSTAFLTNDLVVKSEATVKSAANLDRKPMASWASLLGDVAVKTFQGTACLDGQPAESRSRPET